MPGPPPNPNARRANKRDEGFTELAGRREGPIPPLPGDEWSEHTRDAWQRWWTSPQATQWSEADYDSVLLMAVAFDQAITGGGKAMTEFRQMADRFGLSPMARLRNRWIVKPDSDAEAAAEDAESTVGKVVSLRTVS